MMLSLGDQEKPFRPSILMLFLSRRPKPGVSYTDNTPSLLILAKYLSSALHLNTGHTMGYSAWNALFLAPVLQSHTMIAVGSSLPELAALGEMVTMYFSHGENSMNSTSGWENLVIWWKSSPPHRAMPRVWKV